MAAFDKADIAPEAKRIIEESLFDIIVTLDNPEILNTEKVKGIKVASIVAIIDETKAQGLITSEEAGTIKENIAEAVRIQTEYATKADDVTVNEMLGLAVDAGLEMLENKQKVSSYLKRSASVRTSLEGPNIVKAYTVEQTDERHRSTEEEGGQIATNLFMALNDVALDTGAGFKSLSFADLKKRPELDAYKSLLGTYKDVVEMAGYNSLQEAFQHALDEVNHGKPFSADKASLQNFDFRLGIVSFFDVIDKGFGELGQMMEGMPKSHPMPYLPPKAREPYAVTLGDDNKLYRNGVLLDTTQTNSPAKEPGHDAFVVDPAGNLYATEHKPHGFHHSCFLSGGIVGASGMIRVVDGTVTHVDNVSGHYQPNEAEMVHAIKSIPKEAFIQLTAEQMADLEAVDASTITTLTVGFTPARTQEALTKLFGKEAGGKTEWAIIPSDTGVSILPVMDNKIFPSYDLMREVDQYQLERLDKHAQQWQAKEANITQSTSVAMVVDEAVVSDIPVGDEMEVEVKEGQAVLPSLDQIKQEYAVRHKPTLEELREKYQQPKIQQSSGLDDILAEAAGGLDAQPSSHAAKVEGGAKGNSNHAEHEKNKADNKKNAGKDGGGHYLS